MNFIRLNTAFIPPKEVNEKTIELCRVIGNVAETYLVLDGVNFYPHITIYPPEYPEANIPKILEAIEKLSKSFDPITLKFKNLDVGQGYLGLAFNSSGKIQQLHEEVVHTLNPLREGRIRDKYLEYHMEFSPEQLQNIERYGYPAAMSLYSPHLTITRLKDEDEAKEILRTIKWDISEFVIDKIGVYKTGEHGTCRELVKEFSLT
ncbi:MAG: 2'-5' RNA ligase family protein [Candidatus Colwellbacteria bacterium]